MNRQKVISATVTLGLFQGLGRGLDLLGTLLVARIIAPEAFGIVAAALIVLQLSQSLTELNINDALVQRTDLHLSDYHSAFTISLARGLLITLGMTAAAYPLAVSLENVEIAPVVAGLSLAPLIQSLRSPKTAEYLRRVEPMIPAAVDFAGRLVGFLAMLAIAVFTGSYWSIVVGIVVGATLATVLSYFIAPYIPSISIKQAKWIFSFSGWLNLFTITNAGIAQFDRYFLGNRLGTSILGIYTVATSIASQLVWSLAAPIMNALFAGLSNVKHDAPRLKAGFLLAQSVIAAVMMPLGIGLALVAADFVYLLLGPDWSLAAVVISIVAPATALHMLTVGAHASAMALGRTRSLFIRNLIAFAFNIPLVIFATIHFELIGASVARAATIVIVVLLNLQLARQLVGASYVEQLRNSLRTILSCVLMVAAVFALRAYWQAYEQLGEVWKIASVAGVGGSVYVVTHLALWALQGRPDGLEATLLGMVRRPAAKPES
ncbi:MAG: oligosaccharide flippase family protein [Henriciella sp.]|uniref:oligosaccharide flippase family protein n=1 Tax=Henriciella sp. TaxID=1968823 RepID=UPI003C72C85A